jgi:hypothetical protein
MVASNARKRMVESQLDVSTSAVNDILAILAKHNPGLSKSALKATGRAFAAFSAAAGRLSRDQQRKIVERGVDLAKAVEDAVSEFASMRTPGDNLIALPVSSAVEESEGEGFGELLSDSDGRKRVADYAASGRLEDWAGPVAGPGEIERDFGTKRSTLHDWQKRGAIIGLLRGERKHVYPLAQFIDGRPIEGMSRITKIIANPRAAWLWLTRPHPTADRAAPLERLKQGRVAEVAAAAERDFG